jgi:hypothetical protein
MDTPVDITLQFTTGTVSYKKGQSIQTDFIQIVKAILWTIKPRKSPNVSTNITVVEQSDSYEIISISTSIKTHKNTSKSKILNFSNIVKAASAYDNAIIRSNNKKSINDDDDVSADDDVSPVSNSVNVDNGSESVAQLTSVVSTLNINPRRQQYREQKRKNIGDKVIIQQVPVIVKEEVIREVIKEVEVTKEVIKEVKVGSECTICYDKCIECSLDPCGHVFCMTCSALFLNKPCPNCRTKVNAIKRIYY